MMLLLTGDETLYAIWLDLSAESDNEAYFYIRKDGGIAFEPAGYSGDLYYPTESKTDLEGQLYQPIAINNNLAAVEDNLKIRPTNEKIQSLLRDEYGVSFDPSTQYIQWYVIKYRNTDINGKTYWNVDGVIRNIAEYSVTYNPNGGNANVPSSIQYQPQTKVNVDFSTIPSRAGYEFLGWSEDKNAVDPTYTENGINSFTMPDNDVTLYAVWNEKDNVTINYKAIGGGRVKPESESLRPVTGNAKGSTAHANSGYEFVGWFDDAECTGQPLSTKSHFAPSKDADELWTNATYYAKFEVDQEQTFGYTINYFIQGTETPVPGIETPVTGEGYVGEKITIDHPTVKTGYKVCEDQPTELTVTNDGNASATVYYEVDQEQTRDITYTINFYKEDTLVSEDSYSVKTPVWVAESDDIKVKVQEINYPDYDGFTIDTIRTGNVPDEVTDGTVIAIYYSADTHSTDPNNPDSSDGIPDKYQARIDYTVTNGAFDFGYTYVTLFDEDGNWSETGKGTLDATQIPTARANTGYDQNSFAWQGNTPVAGYEITGDTTFIATFNAIPVTPAPTTPTTPGGGDATAPTATPVVARTVDDGAATTPETEEVEDEETPLSDGDVEDVEDNATPKGNNGIWALINLIAAIVTVILGLILLLSKRHRNDEEEDEEERQARIERGEEKEQEQKRGWICKVLGVIVAIASVVFFILTEDMSLPMALTDKWTIWMIVIAIVELVLVLVGRHWKDVDDEDQEQQA